MTERLVTVGGGRLSGRDDGDGPPVLLLHAGIADLRAWDALVPHLVARGYRAIRFDERGIGGSTSDGAPFVPHDDVIGILDALGVGRAALVGNSRGGRIAFDAAIAHPDRVVAVVGVGAGLGGFDGGSTPLEDELFAEMERLENATPPDGQAIADIDVRVWVDGPGQPPDRVDAAIREAVRMMDAPGYDPDLVEGQPIWLEPRAVDRLAELHCPVLAVAGALDVSEVAETARFLAANAPDARAAIWDDVAHMIGMEQPERLASAIADFLDPIARWS